MQHLKNVSAVNNLNVEYNEARSLSNVLLYFSSTAFNLLLYVSSVLCNQTAEDGILDKRAIIHQLSRREGGHGVEETRSCLLEVTDGHAVETFVRLESVPSIPISSFFYQSVACCVVQR